MYRRSRSTLGGKDDCDGYEAAAAVKANSSLPGFSHKAQVRIDQAEDFVQDILNVLGGAPPVVRIGGFSGGKAQNGLGMIANDDVPDDLGPPGVHRGGHQNDLVSVHSPQLCS